MPTVLRRSGPRFTRQGETFEPRALIHTCEECGGEAGHGFEVDLLRGKPGRWYCGADRAGNPICKRNQGGNL